MYERVFKALAMMYIRLSSIHISDNVKGFNGAWRKTVWNLSIGSDMGLIFLNTCGMWRGFITFDLACWCGNLSVKNREKLNRIYTISCKIAMCSTPDTSLEQLYKSRTLQMATKILSDPTHFLHDCYALLPSGRRYRMPTAKTQWALKSFIPSSIKYLNQPHTK